MNLQALVQRCRVIVAKLRTRFPLRRLIRWGLAGGAIGTAAILTEAMVRARIVAPEARLPSTVYTRATPWGDDAGRRGPVAIATLDGSPLEARVPVHLDEVPEAVTEAVLAVEDQRFFQHHGLDLRRIAGALVANVRAGAIVQGGSTITQQLAKNLFLSSRRTPLRKLREAAMALALELRYDKAAILEAYLNEIYLGQDGDRQIHGVGAAARYYFGKGVGDLSLPESALLAGMISAPNRTAPTRHPEEARERRELVLRLMTEQHRISAVTASRAARARILTRARALPQVDGRFFRDYALSQLPARQPSRGVAVYSSLDAVLQRAANRAVRLQLDRLSTRGAEAALVAIDPRTGEVLAMVGGREYGASQFNRAVDARRQPGSAFKPIVLAAALTPEGGRAPAFTLASVIEDTPLRVRTGKGVWQPTNYDGVFRGEVTIREAMEQSLNVPFARIGLAVGPARIMATARSLGITSPLQPVASLALGSSEVTLLELVRAYGVLAAAGRLAPTRVMALAEGTEPVSVLAMNPGVAYLVTSALEGVVSRGTGRALNQGGRWEGIAGKTGTSNDWRDAWFVAYTPTLVVGVWVGFDDGRSLGLTGAGAALPVVASFLEQAAAAERGGSFEVPEGITEGYTRLASCDREVFLEGTQPDEAGCGWPDPGDWEPAREWGRRLQRQAWKYLEEILAERLERRGNPR